MAKKKKGSSFVKQAAILAMAGILVRILGFLYRLPLTNMIGDLGNAIYSAGYYIYTFLLILSSAGLPAAISKLVSERMALKQYYNAHMVFKVSLFLSGGLGFVFMILLYLFAKPISVLSNYPESYYCIVTLAPTLFIVAIMSAYRGYFQGMNTMVPTAISQIVEQIFNAFFSVYLAYVLIGVGVNRAAGEKNIILGAAGGTAGTGVGALAGLIVVIFAYMLFRPMLFRQISRENRKNPTETKGQIARLLISTAFPIIAGTAVFSITNLIDMNMVTRILETSGFSHERAGELYGQLSGKYVTLTTLPVAISTALATAAIPSIAASVKLKEKENVKRKMNMTLRLSMIISIPAAMGIGVLGDHIIFMLFPKYPSGGILLAVGSVSIVFLALCQTVTGVLQGISRVNIPVIGALLGAITKIVLNYVFISNPSINVVGAVISTTGCYLVASIFNLFMLSYVTKVKPDLMGSIIKPLIGSCIMGIACYSFYHFMYLCFPSEKETILNTISTLFAVVMGMGIYVLVMFLIKGVVEDDLRSMPMGSKLIKICKSFRLL